MSPLRLLSLGPALLLSCGDPDPVPDEETDPAQDTDPPTDTDVFLPDTCGNGVVDPGEACDDGPDNSDTEPDACRTTCVLPRCGDGVVDRDEACDDGNTWGGDGCSPTCTLETLRGEQEPNDHWWQGHPLSSGESVLGALPPFDVDCWSIDVEDNGWVSARASGPEGDCPPDLSLTLYGPEGTLLDRSLAAPEPGACAPITPQTHPGAAYLSAGTYAVCVEGLLRSAVPTYLLQVTTGDDSCLDIEPTPENDLDGDGIADACDPDIDGDGVLNEVDVCPWVSDGPNTPIARTNAGGFLRHWLVAAGLRGDPAGPGGSCDPSPVSRLGEDDATAVPELGDRAGSVPLRIWLPRDGQINFLDVSSASPAREAYAVTWVLLAEPTSAVLHAGVDDGATVWVDGVQLANVTTCQGVTVDEFAWPVFLDAGWHRIVFKIRDTGGGWGMVARLRTSAGDPLGGLETSPVGPWRWDRNQPDRDGDGVGDSCDPEP